MRRAALRDPTATENTIRYIASPRYFSPSDREKDISEARVSSEQGDQTYGYRRTRPSPPRTHDTTIRQCLAPDQTTLEGK